MKKHCCFILVLFVVPLCFSDEIAFSFPGNLEISNYVACETIITTARKERTIIPSYEFLLGKKTSEYVKELSLRIDYYYGQNFRYTHDMLFVLDENEINEINLKGRVLLKKELPEIERESPNVVISGPGYLEPDGEYITHTFYKLVIISEFGKKSFSDFPRRFVDFNIDRIQFTEKNEYQKILSLKDGRFLLKNEYGVPFIEIDYDNKDKEKLLILKNDDICSLFNRTGLIFWGTSGGINRRKIFLPPAIVEATSYLEEKDVSYPPENLTEYPRLDIPWVEGAGAQGIGEKLYLQKRMASALHISIGFVSYTKPYLYAMNSRPREIRLSVDGKFSFVYTLLDTPNYQKITFPDPVVYSDRLTIEILSVYEGTKYQDTCINSIIMQMQ
jgi:hypothetical protein